LEEAHDMLIRGNVDLSMLDEALDRLEKIDQQQGKVVELRYFGGLTIDEVAEVLGVTSATVKRDWTMAKAWLMRELRVQSVKFSQRPRS
jgi:RNA polymerase sigma factor (sigma-70 family)